MFSASAVSQSGFDVSTVSLLLSSRHHPGQEEPGERRGGVPFHLQAPLWDRHHQQQVGTNKCNHRNIFTEMVQLLVSTVLQWTWKTWIVFPFCFWLKRNDFMKVEIRWWQYKCFSWHEGTHDPSVQSVLLWLFRFIEYGEYKGNYYGTSLDSVRSILSKNKVCLLDVQPQVGKTCSCFCLSLVLPSSDHSHHWWRVVTDVRFQRLWEDIWDITVACVPLHKRCGKRLRLPADRCVFHNLSFGRKISELDDLLWRAGRTLELQVEDVELLCCVNQECTSITHLGSSSSWQPLCSSPLFLGSFPCWASTFQGIKSITTVGFGVLWKGPDLPTQHTCSKVVFFLYGEI